MKELPGDPPLQHYKFRFGAHYLALPKLKTREERKKNFPGIPYYISYKRMPEMIKALNQENIYLGFEPYSLDKDPFKED